MWSNARPRRLHTPTTIPERSVVATGDPNGDVKLDTIKAADAAKVFSTADEWIECPHNHELIALGADHQLGSET
ncbi:hypothetical protein E5D57_002081 [Metarhizium anisopliae]|nr:hypothetical protein E5D57_002081 [Metarhizium anisopliae]